MVLPPAKLHGVLDSHDPWLCDAPFTSTRELEFEVTVSAQSRRNPHSRPRDAVRGALGDGTRLAAEGGQRTALALSTMQPHQQPSNLFVLEYLISVSVIASFSFIAFKSSRSPKDLLKACGVSMRKVAKRGARDRAQDVPHRRAARAADPPNFAEPQGVEPLLRPDRRHHRGGGRRGADFARLHVPFVAANWPLAHILRDDEKKQLTGGTWYAWGCTLTMGAPPPARPPANHRNKPTTTPLPKPLPNQATTKPTNPAARARSRRRRSRSRRSSSSCSAT